jgi:hypothetical protein
MLCLGVPFALLVTVGIRRWTARAALYLATLCVLGLVWHFCQQPWWESADDLREVRENVASGAGYEGTDEYTPVGVDASAIDKEARRVTVEGPARAAIHVLAWGAEEKSFTAEMSAPDRLALRLFNYPAWRVEVNGHVVQPGRRAGAGQMLVPVEAGMNRIEITFARTWDRKLGGWISLLALILMWFSTRYEVDLTWIPNRTIER